MTQTPADLLRRISSSEAGEDGVGAAERMIRGPAGSGKTDLIQVVSSCEAQPQEPRHRLQLEADRRVRLTVELPEVSSVSECQLTISKVSGERFNELALIPECQSWMQPPVCVFVCHLV